MKCISTHCREDPGYELGIVVVQKASFVVGLNTATATRLAPPGLRRRAATKFTFAEEEAEARDTRLRSPDLS